MPFSGPKKPEDQVPKKAGGLPASNARDVGRVVISQGEAFQEEIYTLRTKDSIVMYVTNGNELLGV